MIRLNLVLALTTCFLSACSGEVGLGENPKTIFSRASDIPEVSAQFRQLAQANAPALLASIKDRNQVAAFMRLTSRNGVENWIGANNVSIDFRSGFLVGSRGLGGDLMAADVTQSVTLVLGGGNGLSKRFHSYLDGEDQIVTRSYVCKINSRGTREVDLGKRVATTRLMEERCQNGDQRFQNLYWVELGSRSIVQSRQWAGDYIGAITFRIILK